MYVPRSLLAMAAVADIGHWSRLVQADAAISAVADRLGISKSALLDPSASDPAVKVALAEAHTLAETKRYFEGVSSVLGRV